MELECGLVVNCAGLGAVALARSIADFPPSVSLPTPYFCKGNYFRLEGKPAAAGGGSPGTAMG
jgi:L-2-hydroxyglutarate oxidase LhgO